MAIAGLRFRIMIEHDTIRNHIKIFINEEQARSLADPLQSGDHIYYLHVERRIADLS